MREPTTPYDSKMVMIRGERGDTITFDDGPLDTASVAKRTNPYYGPKLLLDDGEQNWLLTAPAPDRDLQLWRAIVDDDGFRKGWERAAEVTAELEEGKQYDICTCGEPLKTLEHQREAALGIGEHG